MGGEKVKEREKETETESYTYRPDRPTLRETDR